MDHEDNRGIVEMDRQEYWIDRIFFCLIENEPESNNDDNSGMASASGDYSHQIPHNISHQLRSIIIILDSLILTLTRYNIYLGRRLLLCPL